MTSHCILDVLNITRDFLEKHGIDTARIDAEWILAHALHLSRFDLYLKFDQPLNETDLAMIRPLVSRRANREPLAYILGEAHFHDTVLKVDPRVLIPRPETEMLVEHILRAHPGFSTLLDLCTGSGAIAIAIAKARPGARITASDVSPTALELARENAILNDTNIEFVLSDLFCNLRGRFEIIVSNPPYVTEDEYPTLQPEIVRFEPRLALTASENGLSFYRRILEQAADFLAPGGTLWFEIGHGQAEGIFRMGERLGWQRDRLLYDDCHLERNISFQRHPGE